MSEIKLYNDDALDILKNIPSETIDLICTDVPYKITVKGGYQVWEVCIKN